MRRQFGETLVAGLEEPPEDNSYTMILCNPIEVHHNDTRPSVCGHFFEGLETIHTSTHPITEEQTNRFAIVGAPYAFRDDRADI